MIFVHYFDLYNSHQKALFVLLIRHGVNFNNFDYSKTEYVDKTSIKIICITQHRI